MNYLNRYAPLAGRILIALIFVISGFGKVTGFEYTVGYIASKGLPLPQLAAIIAIIVELGGSAMLILGWKTRWVATVLLVYTVVAAFAFHGFWAVSPEQVSNQMNNFLKNISMAGGLLYVVIHGSVALGLEPK